MMEVLCHILVSVIVIACVIHSTFSCPGDCSCSIQKKTVTCDGKKLTTIPANIPLDTETLDLKSNNIEKITKSAFQKLTNLKKIHLDFNKITTLEAGTFSNLKDLEVISLGTNSLTFIPKGVFWDLASVNAIVLTNNYITGISDAFRNISKLIRLDLDGNSIKSIKNTDFRQIPSLVDLILSNNNISKIDRFSFRPLITLAYLSLKGNILQKADGLLMKNRRLTYVDLSQCQLKSVPKGLPKAIQHLQLDKNNISKIKMNDFKGRANLNIIVLDENQIELIIPNSFSSQKNLQQLWLNSNKLTKFPSPFSASVTNLLIAKNNISRLSPSDFPKDSKINQLVLNGNPLDSIDENAFQNLGQLKNMWMNSNKMTKLSNNMFSGLKNLKLLSISNNQISDIEIDCFSGLTSLKELGLASSLSDKITVEGDIFKHVSQLDILDMGSSEGLAKIVLNSQEMITSIQNISKLTIEDNHMYTLNSSSVDQMSRLKVIKLGMNRWHCDERISWMASWLKKNAKLVHNKNDVTCYTPRSLKNRKIITMKAGEFVDVTTTSAPATSNMPTTDIFQVSDLVNFKTEKATTKETKSQRPQTTTMASQTITSEIVREIITERNRAKKKYTMKKSKSMSTETTTITSVTSSMTVFTNPKQRITSSPDFNDTRQNDTKTENPLLADGYISANHTTDKNTTMSKSMNSPDTGTLEEDKANFNLIIIIIATTLTLLLILVIIIVIVIICRKREKVVYHRALQYDRDNGDVVFFVGDNPPCVATINKPSRSNSRSRSERGSTSSRPSEDITNELESTMKIYSLDEE